MKRFFISLFKVYFKDPIFILWLPEKMSFLPICSISSWLCASGEQGPGLLCSPPISPAATIEGTQQMFSEWLNQWVIADYQEYSSVSSAVLCVCVLNLGHCSGPSALSSCSGNGKGFKLPLWEERVPACSLPGTDVHWAAPCHFLWNAVRHPPSLAYF